MPLHRKAYMARTVLALVVYLAAAHTDRNLYKKMSGPTKTCSVKAPAALSAQQKSALLLFAIEKFFFAKDVVDQFG